MMISLVQLQLQFNVVSPSLARVSRMLEWSRLFLDLPRGYYRNVRIKLR